MVTPPRESDPHHPLCLCVDFHQRAKGDKDLWLIIVNLLLLKDVGYLDDVFHEPFVGHAQRLDEMIFFDFLPNHRDQGLSVSVVVYTAGYDGSIFHCVRYQFLYLLGKLWFG